MYENISYLILISHKNNIISYFCVRTRKLLTCLKFGLVVHSYTIAEKKKLR